MVRMVPAVRRGVIAHTSALNASSGYPSTALMLSTELGCTVAKPPDTAHDMLAVPGAHTPQSSEALVGSVCIRPQFARHAVLTYRKTACYHPALQWPPQGLASAAQWMGHGWRGHPSLRTRRECWLARCCLVSARGLAGACWRASERLVPCTVGRTHPWTCRWLGEAGPESIGSCRMRHRHSLDGGRARRERQRAQPWQHFGRVGGSSWRGMASEMRRWGGGGRRRRRW